MTVQLHIKHFFVQMKLTYPTNTDGILYKNGYVC